MNQRIIVERPVCVSSTGTRVGGLRNLSSGLSIKGVV